MDYERYEFGKGPTEFEYEFYSVGPNGRIKKIVDFQKIKHLKNQYNLAFTDWDEKSKQKSDKTVTNNMDREKVLATVGAIALDFLIAHPNAIITAQGTTNSRVRLYQMSITRIIDKLDSNFVIEGCNNEEWEPFEKGFKYEAFLLKIKT